MIEIRTATATDAAALAELAVATFALACPPHTSAEAIAAFLRDVLAEGNFDAYLADPDRLILVAEVAGEAGEAGVMLGYTMLVFAEPADDDARAAATIRPTAELSKCYLRAETHGRGVAAALMNATLDAARARGAAGSWLGVNQENARAIRFYEKNGFVTVGEKRFLVGERYEDDFVLERAL
ncbi:MULTISPECIES: GNAT family N-acetyltransferase [unclassified Cryobacterium]|uniref:GNAT family N-acetyltransferase n=1 Tax=unclassified Cryobacterium TaxID=2649013 RepID=UPI00106A19FF|nr:MULTISPECIES: GNAT family N-acetyltransferase [unclassified Cryobacterium]TFB56632.1 N-acetyltransferase [Cryobacterium sp. Sr3]TFC31835.1 N-acetyltransferase [Cryobacterium sp. TMT2-18-2]TFC64881.1 N-acetyltransferase [Cryobacterium sp. TMT2-18-3]